MTRHIVRAKLPDGEEIFFGTYASYDKAEAIADDLISGEFDDAIVETLNIWKPRVSRWWSQVAFRRDK